jgi:hypothetical protein
MHGSNPSRTSDQDQTDPRAAWHLPALVGMLAAVLLVGVAVVVTDDSNESDTAAAADVAADASTADASLQAATGAVDPAAAALGAAAAATPETVVQPSVDLNGCTLEVTRVELGDTGASVECVQKALTAAGFYTGAITGTFDDATDARRRVGDPVPVSGGDPQHRSPGSGCRAPHGRRRDSDPARWCRSRRCRRRSGSAHD